MAEKTNAPEIRFEGFTDPWEQRKFSDLTDRVSIQSSDPDLPQVEYEDIISGEGTLNKDLRDKEGGKTGIKFYAEDVLYGKLRPYLMNWLYPQFNGVAVGDFWVLRVTGCDSSFLYRLVQTDSFQRLANASSGSKMPRADWNLISQSFFAVPADHAEQKAIAKSLAELDSLITLHQRKYDKLCTVKKSMLDKMFPKPGETEPEIRFEGFTDPWEQRKLGELCTISKGHGYSKADIRDVGTPLILYGRLYTQYESRIEDVDTFVVGQEGSLLSKGNEVIVPASGETAEDIAVASSVRRPGIIFGGDLNVVTPVRKLDPDYTALAITYSKAHDDLAKRAQGKSVVHVHGNDIAEVEVSYPSESEQKRISTVVLGLDNLITLHRRKLNILKNTKKSLLDKMFV